MFVFMCMMCMIAYCITFVSGRGECSVDVFGVWSLTLFSGQYYTRPVSLQLGADLLTVLC